MTKSQLIERVASRTPHISKRDIEIVVDTLLGSMREALVRGERIEIRGFGSFRVGIRKACAGFNPRTGERIQIPRGEITASCRFQRKGSSLASAF